MCVDELPSTIAGSCEYLCPELLSFEKPAPACDQWSLGVLVYALLVSVCLYTAVCVCVWCVYIQLSVCPYSLCVCLYTAMSVCLYTTMSACPYNLSVCPYSLSGNTPFLGDSDEDTRKRITKGLWEFPRDGFKDVSFKAKDFVKGLINKEAKFVFKSTLVCIKFITASILYGSSTTCTKIVYTDWLANLKLI